MEVKRLLKSCLLNIFLDAYLEKILVVPLTAYHRIKVPTMVVIEPYSMVWYSSNAIPICYTFDGLIYIYT